MLLSNQKTSLQVPFQLPAYIQDDPNYANFVLNSKGEFLVGNIKQEKIFHYVEKDIVDQQLVDKLKELVNGS